MDYYWSQKNSLSAQDVQDLRNDDDKSGFLNSHFGQSEDTASSDKKKYYDLGEKMYSEICTDDTLSDCTSQY